LPFFVPKPAVTQSSSASRPTRARLEENVPYDQFVGDILTATGDYRDSPPVNWFWQMTDDPLHQPTTDAAGPVEPHSTGERSVGQPRRQNTCCQPSTGATRSSRSAS